MRVRVRTVSGTNIEIPNDDDDVNDDVMILM